MRGLYDNTNLAWTGFYLAPAPSQGYTGWMDKAATLRAMGWGLAPLFVGQQWPGGPGSHVLTAAQGTTDGAAAIGLAQRAAIGTGAVIYLDIEIGGRLPANFLEYARAWFAAVRASEFRPGTYCSYLDTPSQLKATDPDLFFWVFNVNRFAKTQTQDADGRFRTPPIADSGCAFAIGWQYIQGAPSIPVAHSDGSSGTLTNVDMDCATVLDPSQPDHDAEGGVVVTPDGSGSATRPASITAAASSERAAAAPTFEVDPGSGTASYYAVEVATRAELFDDALHGAERTEDDFYGTWEDTAFLAASPYQLPDAVWQRIGSADRLFYRAWFSTSADAWTDAAVTTADADAASAPSIELTGERETRSEPQRHDHPGIVGPATAARDGEPPTFSISLPNDAKSCVVELAADYELFAGEAGRSDTTFYASPVRGVSEGTEFSLPVDAWERLRSADRLFFRVLSSRAESATGWHAQDNSTPDAVAERAPWLDVVAAGERTRDAQGSVTRVLDPDELMWRARPD
jgi:hypothetical protein